MKIKRYIYLIIIMICGLLMLSNKSEAATAQNEISNGTYNIKAVENDNYVFSVAGGSVSNYANIEMATNKNSDNQRFVFKHNDDGSYSISPLHSNKGIDIHVSSFLKPNNIIQYDKQNYVYQKWVLKSAGNGYYYIISKYNDLYMTIEGTLNDGTNISLKSNEGNISQKFKIEKVEEEKIDKGIYQIVSAKNSNYVLNVANCSNANYANIEIAQNQNNENQRFDIIDAGNDSYYVRAIHSNKNLDIHVSSKIAPNNLIQYSKQNYIYQKWIIRSAGDGFYYIVSSYNNLYLSVDGEAKNGSNVSLQKYRGDSSQKFKFKYVKKEKIQEGTYKITSALNNMVFNVAGGSTSNYANLGVTTSNNGNNQKYAINVADDDSYTITAMHSNKNIDIHASSLLNPNNLIQYAKQNYIYQKWIIKSAGNGLYYIVSKYNNLYVSVNGDNVLLKQYTGDNSQKFILECTDTEKIKEGLYKISNIQNKNYVINITNSSEANHAGITMEKNQNKDNQRFNFVDMGDGSYIINALHSNKNIDIDILTDKLIQYIRKDYIYQRWILRKAGNGYYYIVSKYNNMYMTVEENVEDGVNVSLDSFRGDNTQKFMIDVIEGINITEGTYGIVSAKNEKYALNIAGYSVANYGNLEIAENKNNENQKYEISKDDSGKYSIMAVHSNKTIDIHVSSLISNNNLIQYDTQNYIYQKWIFRDAGNGYVYIMSEYNGGYISLDGDCKNGTNVSLKSYSGDNSQKFKLISYENEKIADGSYQITPAQNEDYVLNISNGLTSNNANLEIGYNNHRENQKFRLTCENENLYTITAQHSDKNIDIYPLTNLVQNSKQNRMQQKWIIRSAGDGYYYVISKYNNMYMTVDGDIKTGVNISIKPYNGSILQKFKLKVNSDDGTIESLPDAEVDNGTYSIVSAKNSEYVWNIEGASKDNYANLEISKDNKKSNQRFGIKCVETGTYTFSPLHSNKNIDISVSSASSPNNLIQYNAQEYIYQKWAIKSVGDGYYCIVSKCNNLCVSIDGDCTNGTNVTLKPYSGDDLQKFKLILCEDMEEIEEEPDKALESGVYKIVSGSNENYALDISGSSDSNYANVQLLGNNDKNNQKFIVNSDSSDNTYTFCAGHSNKYMDIHLSANCNVIQYQYQGYIYQKWIIKYAGDGYYYIISRYNGLCLDIDGESVQNGTNITLKQYSGKVSQKFKFVKTTIEDNGRSAQFKREHPEIRIGIDVSKYQGTIDWNAVKRDGIDYVMIRAGFRGYGESGSLNEDPKLDEYVRGASAAGLDVGIYFFSQATCYQEGVTEANYTLGLIRKYDITYPVAFDTEESSSPDNTGRADGISAQARTDAAKGFCSTIKAAGYDTLIYASPSWLKDELYLNQLSEYDIWLANYTGATQEDPLKRPSSYKGKYVMWQYTDSGTVNGINGKVDCDLFYYLK